MIQRQATLCSNYTRIINNFTSTSVSHLLNAEKFRFKHSNRAWDLKCVCLVTHQKDKIHEGKLMCIQYFFCRGYIPRAQIIIIFTLCFVHLCGKHYFITCRSQGSE